MSTVSETTPSTVIARARVGWLDLVWLTWRQHRAALISTAVGVLALGGWVLWNCNAIATPAQYPDGSGRTTPDFGAISLGYYQTYLAAVFAGIIAVFWAAPLLAREYEQRTHLLAWSQDVTRGRWLAGKVLTLGAVAVLLAVTVGVLVDHLTGVIAAHRPTGINLYGRLIFEAYPALQAAYVLFGLSLGLLFSAVFRRVLPAAAVTLATYAVVRVVVANFRFDYITPIRQSIPFTSMINPMPSTGDLPTSDGYLTASGQVAHQLPAECSSPNPTSFGVQSWVNCLRQHGIAGQYQDFQPGYRLVEFRLIEVGIFVTLAVVCGVLTRLRMRRLETT